MRDGLENERYRPAALRSFPGIAGHFGLTLSICRAVGEVGLPALLRRPGQHDRLKTPLYSRTRLLAPHTRAVKTVRIIRTSSVRRMQRSWPWRAGLRNMTGGFRLLLRHRRPRGMRFFPPKGRYPAIPARIPQPASRQGIRLLSIPPKDAFFRSKVPPIPNVPGGGHPIR